MTNSTINTTDATEAVGVMEAAGVMDAILSFQDFLDDLVGAFDILEIRAILDAMQARLTVASDGTDIVIRKHMAHEVMKQAEWPTSSSR
jgi:hypothetical protein